MALLGSQDNKRRNELTSLQGVLFAACSAHGKIDGEKIQTNRGLCYLLSNAGGLRDSAWDTVKSR